MPGPPTTLPADFFNNLDQQQPPATLPGAALSQGQQPTAPPPTLPADFFDKQGAPPPVPQRKPGDSWGTPMRDTVAGALASGANTAVNLYDGLRWIPGLDKILPPSDKAHALIDDVAPNNFYGGLGKLQEQGAEYYFPSSKLAAVQKAAGVSTALKATSQGLLGSGLSAAQTGGAPVPTLMGGLLGAAGELVGPAVEAGRRVFGVRAPNLRNFTESFGNATPGQKEVITHALDVLKNDKIVPPTSPQEMKEIIVNKLGELGQKYNALDPLVSGRRAAATPILDELRKAQQGYMLHGEVTNPEAWAILENQINTFGKVANKNNGLVSLADVVHMKGEANGMTSWDSPSVQRSVWKKIGDVYRAGASNIAPETKDLNDAYQKYKDLEALVQENLDKGKGFTPSGLDKLGEKHASRSIGAALGGGLGYATGGGLPAASIGTLIGGLAGPKVVRVVGQGLRNASDTGRFAAMSGLLDASKLIDKKRVAQAVVRGGLLSPSRPPKQY